MTAISKNKPSLRFPEFKGAINLLKLSEVSTWQSGGTPSKDEPDYWNGEIPWISASSMRGIKYFDSDLKITSAGLKNGSKLAPKGALLILVRGSMLFNKIPIGIATKDVAFNQDVKSIIAINGLSAEYLLYWFIASESKILSMVTGTGIGAGKLDLSELKAMDIYLPSLPEQKKIATLFSDLDTKIQNLRERKSNLEKYKKGVSQKIFSQEIRFKVENGKYYPKWSAAKLSEVATIKYGKDQKGVETPNGIYPILGTGGEMGRTNKYLCNKPSVLIGRKGTIDKPRYMDTPFWTVDTLFYTEIHDNTIPKWLFYKFETINWYLYNEASGVPSLSASTINKISINLPSIQLSDDTKLIVTTIQKLNTAISKQQYWGKIDKLRDERIVFIFDECHRSQFGDTHNRIKGFFNNIQMFGFTGTPIFADNAVKNELGRRTTKELFGDCLHKYVITDAIKDENVLKFSVEYVGRYKQKEGRETNIDIEVEDIDTKELMDSPLRLEKITDYIIANHNRKTHSQEFTAMFCVSSVENLIKYYDLFQKKKEAGQHNLKIATIFSYVANEDDADANGYLPDELSIVGEPEVLYGLKAHSHEKLDEYIVHYNKMYATKFSTKDSETFYNYYKDVSKKVKERKIDILVVVNMFLTGFDCKTLSTLYVDKNLKFHGLIQAYSRTNRILNDLKSQGNIVVFRNLKNATDEAITLFSNKEAIEVIIMKPYEDYAQKFNEAFEKLLTIAPTVNSVNDLETENDELKFIWAFRDLMRIKNILTAFSDFKWSDLSMSEQLFEDYKSKYLDLYDKVKSDHQKEKVSILEDVDFELELIHRDEINVAYIIQLLIKLKANVQGDVTQAEKEIFNLLNNESNLRSKRELIEKFIKENLPVISDSDNLPQEFDKFWNEEQKKALDKLVKEENLSAEKTQKLIDDYLFAEREPLRDEVLELLEGEKPTVLERKKIGDRILSKIKDFVETFISGMSGN